MLTASHLITMVKAKSLDDDFFIRNAVLCWLHFFGNKGHKWEDIYKELAERDTYAPKPKPRPARRRKPTTAVK